MPVKIIPLDASSLKMAFCQQAYTYAIVRGLSSTLPAEPLVKGTAIHMFAEMITKDPANLPGALNAARAEWAKVDSDQGHFLSICSAMPTTLPAPYQWEENGAAKIGVEFFFKVPWLGFTLAGEEYEIHIMGTFDRLNFDGDTIRVIDYKSSRKWDINDIFKQYHRDTQLSFYNWAIARWGHLFLPPEMHAAAAARRITTQVCAVQIGNKRDPKWLLSPAQSLNETELTLFEKELRSHIHTDIIPAWEAPAHAARNGWVSGQCGMCRYNSLCHADESMVERIIETQYEVRRYDPANFRAPKNNNNESTTN